MPGAAPTGTSSPVATSGGPGACGWMRMRIAPTITGATSGRTTIVGITIVETATAMIMVGIADVP